MTDEKHHSVAEMPRSDPNAWHPKWFAILDAGEYWCDFKLIKCCVWDSDGNPLHYGEGCYPSEECADIEKAEPTISGFIKWDGCMESRLGSDQFALHTCDGAGSVIEIADAWLWLLSEAHAAMTKAGRTPDWEPEERLKR